MELYINNPTGRRTEAYVVVISNVSLFFSYSTCIAFQHGRIGYRLHNAWGPTTGRHMGEFGVLGFTVVPPDEFDQRLTDALYETVRAETSDTKQLAYT